MSSGYLVKIQFEISRTKVIHQSYLVTRAERDRLQKLNYYNEGGCCSQSGCIQCHGMTAKYHSHLRVRKDQIELASFVNDGHIISLKSLLSYVDDASEEEGSD